VIDADDDDHFRFRRCLDFLDALGVAVEPGSTWLDLGCNQGHFLRLLLKRHRVRAVGFDAWDAAQKTPGPDDIWDYRTANLDRELPWPEKVRFISALEVLEHMIDTDGFLKRAFDGLQPGGWLVISTPNINSLRNRIMVPLGHYPAGLEYRTEVHHVRLYNVPTLREHLRATGFGRIEMRGVACLPMTSPLGRGGLSTWLADRFPSLCGNLIAVAQKP
jgi:2-polyprenyl-3-methyl-5-hydroxy-6-metoxy-1,4-benzoquinol methylase